MTRINRVGGWLSIGALASAGALSSSCGSDSGLFTDSTTTTSGAGGSSTSSSGSSSGGGGSSGVVRVGVMSGMAYSDGLRFFLDDEPDIEADNLNACILGELMAFDVVIVHDQMTCFEQDDFDTFVLNGGGLIGLPWIHDYGEITALPVTPDVLHKEMGTALEIFAIDDNDPLLKGVTFQSGDWVAYTRGALPPRTGATLAARWADSSNTSAVVRWPHGYGRAVFLNFQYTNTCCPTAIQYEWGQTLMRNAVLWAAQ